MRKRIAIIGTNGIPARYGGFETLAENIVELLGVELEFQVYCSNIYKRDERKREYKGAKLIYLPIRANGIHSIFYDIINTFHAWFTSDVLLILGPAAGFILPLNFFFKKKIIVNHGGLNEWERVKLSFFEKKYAFYNHLIASKFANYNIADNIPLKESIQKAFNVKSEVIEYGGDHVSVRSVTKDTLSKYPFLNLKYDLSVSRAQPDNNLHLLLEVYKFLPERNLVLISNWSVSDYGIKLKDMFINKFKNIFIVDAVYDKKELDIIRSNSKLYIHTHSQCGTAPSLVEAMNYNIPIICFDVPTNRATTQNRSLYFSSESDLLKVISELNENKYNELRSDMFEIAKQNYTWSVISSKYKNLILN